MSCEPNVQGILYAHHAYKMGIQDTKRSRYLVCPSCMHVLSTHIVGLSCVYVLATKVNVILLECMVSIVIVIFYLQTNCYYVFGTCNLDFGIKRIEIQQR